MSRRAFMIGILCGIALLWVLASTVEFEQDF